jgi:hypothetical protein
MEEAASLFSKGNFLECIKLVDEALEHEPRNAALWRMKGLCLSRLGRYEEAGAAFTKSIVLEPQEPLSFIERAKCYVFELKFEKAISDFEFALSRTVERDAKVDILAAMGLVCMLKGDERADEFFQKAYAIDPKLTLDDIQLIFERIFIPEEIAAEVKLEVQRKIGRLRDMLGKQ